MRGGGNNAGQSKAFTTAATTSTNAGEAQQPEGATEQATFPEKTGTTEAERESDLGAAEEPEGAGEPGLNNTGSSDLNDDITNETEDDKDDILHDTSNDEFTHHESENEAALKELTAGLSEADIIAALRSYKEPKVQPKPVAAKTEVLNLPEPPAGQFWAVRGKEHRPFTQTAWDLLGKDKGGWSKHVPVPVEIANM